MGNVLMSMISHMLSEIRYLRIDKISSSKSFATTSLGLSGLKSLRIPVLQSWRLSVSTVLAAIRRARLYLTKGRKNNDTIMSSEMERKYWKSAAKDRMVLLRSDARFVGTSEHRIGTMPPVILSYTPALSPEKKSKRKTHDYYFISPKTYCKWHRMVFPGSKHPTIAEAAKLRDAHDPEELRQIYHISRMLPDDQVFPDSDGLMKPWSPRYQRKWRKWNKSRDVDVIFFSEEFDDPSTRRKCQDSSTSLRFPKTRSKRA